jgi:RND family efflux transporter MFP subunit
MQSRLSMLVASAPLLMAACGGGDERTLASADGRTEAPGRVVTVADTTIAATLEAAGIAEPVAQATLSTKLMGTVTEVLVREGDRVAAGQPLLRIDARDIAAKQSQVGAGIAEAEAVHRDATTQLARMRALHADSAATRAQLDAAETGYARAEAAVRQARAAAGELAAMRDYAVVRAPFAGVVTQRFVDPGAFAAPGAPLLTVQDGRRLRVSVATAPDAVRAIDRGATVAVTIEGTAATATVEGVVPAPTGHVYTVNAIVENAGGRFLPGSAATLSIPLGPRRAIVVPEAAVRRDDDLAGVVVRGAAGDELRWIKLGATMAGQVEVLGGLVAGERVVVPIGSDDVATVDNTGGR